MSKDLTPREIGRKIAAGGSHNIPGKDVPVKAVAVKTIADRPAPVFVTVSHPEAEGIPGSFDTSGSSGGLRASRPDIPYGAIWCGKCNKPCDFDEGGLHNLFGKVDSEGKHRGYILIRAYCHGREADICLTFQQARHNRGRAILAFLYPEAPKRALAVNVERFPRRLALPAPPVRLLLMDKGQNWWTKPVSHCYRVQHDFSPVDPDKIVAVAYLKTPENESAFDRLTREIIERFNKRRK